MINPKYLSDMQKFPAQLSHHYDVRLIKKYDRIIVCGMGGSALYAPLVQDLLVAWAIDCRLDVASSYQIPPCDRATTLIICASHSGNTEETLSCFAQAVRDSYDVVVFASGGKLLAWAQEHNLPFYHIPTWLQPRLSTGYFLIALLDVIYQAWYDVSAILSRLQSAASLLSSLVDVSYAQDLAKKLLHHVPLVYTSDTIRSLSTICKIKINENSKMPAFAHYIPEMNHNEMVGWTGQTMKPYFIFALSQYTHPRNHRRAEVMKELFEKAGYPVVMIPLHGETLEAEVLMLYHLMDYVTYYLADTQGIDPEPVAMVEDFKKILG